MDAPSRPTSDGLQPGGNGLQLPHAILPLLVGASRSMLEHTRLAGAETRPMLGPGGFDGHNWYGLAALAAVYTRQSPDNPLCGDRRLAELIRHCGQALAARFNDPACADPNGWWYEENRFDEWVTEMWLLGYDLLKQAGANELIAGWDQPLLKAGAAMDRYCRQAEHLRRMTSPNLKISTNHFVYFAADLIRIGQVFGIDDYVQRGLAVARKIAEHQHPDGYWAETHGPTTSYNQISSGAMGLCDCYTGEPIFAEALRRSLDFHSRFSYPDGQCLETIDQRVRYPSADGVFCMFAFSRWPDGRGWAELRFANNVEKWRTGQPAGVFGRLATNYVYYRPGPAAPPACVQPAYHARLSDLPGGIVKRDGWAVGLCGIASRPRNHRYTLDRQNLLSVWHRDCGLIIGGGNSRDDPASATFYSRIANDPTALVHGIMHEHVYVPVDARLGLDGQSGSLDLEYWGFDARLDVRIVDERTCRISARTGTLPANGPILFNPNIILDGSAPLRTGKGTLATGGQPWQRTGEQLGGWFGQGSWRIEAPAECTLHYPVQPYSPVLTKIISPIAVLTVPVTNRVVDLAVRVEGQGI